MLLPKLPLHALLFVILLVITSSHQEAIETPKDTQPSTSQNESTQPESFAEDPVLQPSSRQNRMLNFWDYYNYNTPFYPIPQPAFIPYPYYGGYDQYDDMEDEDYEMDIASRANIASRRPGSKRRTQYQDSPIFYIRLPPTPYMFVPGSGYMSQPPTFNPLMPMPPVSPPMPAMPAPMRPVAPVAPVAPVPVSPFISIPLNFVSNARPTSIFHFGSSLQPQYTVPQPPSMPSQFGVPAIPSYQPTYQPTYQPARPHRPTSRPKPSMTDSEVTQLKGQFLFNGRPNQIYLLTNSPPNPVYTNRINPYYWIDLN